MHHEIGSQLISFSVNHELFSPKRSTYILKEIKHNYDTMLENVRHNDDIMIKSEEKIKKAKGGRERDRDTEITHK